MKRAGVFLIVFVFALLLYERCATTTHVKIAPPPLKKEAIPKDKPYPGAVWISGQWRWDSGLGRYIWVPGHWVKAPKGKVWKPAHWKKTPRGWVWVPGCWVRR